MRALILATVLLTGCGMHPGPNAGGHQPAAYSVLVFSRTTGFRHDSIPAAIELVRRLGTDHGFQVTATEDPGTFQDDQLSRYRAVVFLLTTGDVLDDSQRAAFERYIARGGGFVGVHSAADTEYGWAWYDQLLGTHFLRHPAIQSATVLVEDPLHPSTARLPRSWRRVDEWYDFRGDPRPHVHVLLTVDETTYQGGGMGADHPIAWCHQFDGGRSWYTALGHATASYSDDEAFAAHLLGGITWAAGGPGKC